STFQPLGKLARDVFPKRSPLLFLIPHVLTLEERNLKPHLLFEQCQNGNRVGIHGGADSKSLKDLTAAGFRRAPPPAHWTAVRLYNRSSVSNRLSIDPRVFIRSPFLLCPNCGRETFGVLAIGGSTYSRRCRECWYTTARPLWPLQRKVIYLDQFAISNMAKALDRAMAGHERAVRDGFWLELFEALERACKLQLAICPSSDAHTEESSLSEVRRSLKRMYEHLSHGVAFDDFEQVACAQLAIAARAWIKGEAPAYMFDPESITAGGLQEWHERYNITVDLPYPPSIIKAIEDFRQGVHGHVAELFEEWRAHPRKDFDYWIAREREA